MKQEKLKFVFITEWNSSLLKAIWKTMNVNANNFHTANGDEIHSL
jgi:hypothetical protein